MDSNVLIPNVEGMDLNQSILSSLDNIKRIKIDGNETRYYTIPEVSDIGRNCSGEVVSIKYCYLVNNNVSSNRNIFDIVLGTMNGTSFTVTSRFAVVSKPTNTKCSQIGTSNRKICCDNNRNSSGIFTLPSSKYVYGIYLRRRRQLAITNTYPVTWYQRDGRAIVNRKYQLDNSQSGSFILMQFSLGKCKVVRLMVNV